AIAVDRRLSGQSEGQLAVAAAALAQAGQPEAARILSGPASPGPPGGIPGLAGAFPLPNAAGLLRGTNEQSTTVITFLYFRPGTSFGAQKAGAHAVVAAAGAALEVARATLPAAVGPGQALTVLTAMVGSVTLGPALMAIFGGLLFRPVPRWLRRQGVTRREGGGRKPARPRRQ